MKAINRKDDSSLRADRYDDMLDEIYGEIDVCGLKMNGGYILKELNPIAYRCGLNDRVDSCDDEWECGECGNLFDDFDECEDCCKERTDEEIEEDNKDLSIKK